MVVENPQTNQGLEAIVVEATQLRRIQRINLGVAVGSLVAGGAIEVAHKLVWAPHSEILVLLALEAVAIAGIGVTRVMYCELQGRDLEQRALIVAAEGASRRPPTLSNGPQSV